MNDIKHDEPSNKRIKLDDEDNDWNAERIAHLSYQAYSQLGKSGKPDPNKEHTVLACVVENVNKVSRVVALTTGTKCFPQNISSRHEDIVDCHAESLLKRAFKQYLITQLELCLKRKKSLDQFQDEFCKVRKYCLFVSQTPCGCVSRWQGDYRRSIEHDCTETKLESYKTVGVNRKPGRGNRCPKAGCIHKLAKWNIFGMQGKALLPFTGKAIIPQKIVIGNCEPTPDQFSKQEMHSRFSIDPIELQSIQQQLKKLECFNFDSSYVIPIELASRFRFNEFVRESNNSTNKKKPAGSCIVAWLQDSENPMRTIWKSEVIASGRKLGAGRKTAKNNDWTRPRDSTDDVTVTLTGLAANSEKAPSSQEREITSASRHRPGDLAASDRALNRRIELLLPLLNDTVERCTTIADDTRAEGIDCQLVLARSAKFSVDKVEMANYYERMTQIYQHNWHSTKCSISIFKGWPSLV